MCDTGFDDGPEMSAEEWRRARKGHVCYACRESIRPGDRYHIWRSLYEGSWSTLKHCSRCWAMVDALGDADFTDAVVLSLDCGDTWESASGESPPEHIAALAFWLPGEPLPAPTSAPEEPTP